MRTILTAFAASTLLFAATVSLIAEPKGPRTTISGEVVDMWCYLEGGDHGATNKPCATACARAGNPIAILDTKGNVYGTVGLKDHQPAQTLLLDRMSDQVTVTGTLVKKGGVQMIYVETVK